MGSGVIVGVAGFFDSVADRVITRRECLHDTHTIILIVVSILWGGGIATHYILQTLWHT